MLVVPNAEVDFAEDLLDVDTEVFHLDRYLFPHLPGGVVFQELEQPNQQFQCDPSLCPQMPAEAPPDDEPALVHPTAASPRDNAGN